MNMSINELRYINFAIFFVNLTRETSHDFSSNEIV